MFPLYDSIPAKRFPFLNVLLIVITVYVFLQQLFAHDQTAFISHYALIPATIDFSNLNTLYPFITAIFLHGGFLHIISNMWFLPGDILIKKENFTFYFPWVTSLVISVALSLIFYIFFRK